MSNSNMNSFAFLLLCIQAYLVQNAVAQCHGNYGPVGPGAYVPGAGIPPLGYAGYTDYGYPAAEWAVPYGLDAYGGAGEGNVAVAGDLPVAGSTVLSGQVPIMGAVSFAGPVPAVGSISITGNCACGCSGPYMY